MEKHLINLMDRKLYRVETQSKKVLGFPIEFGEIIEETEACHKSGKLQIAGAQDEHHL